MSSASLPEKEHDGDIIPECPLLKWQLDDAAEGESKASSERLFKAAKGIKTDVVVMTQACDLEQGKVSDVVLCPCRPLSRYRPVWEAVTNPQLGIGNAIGGASLVTS